jgi:hypothetical protein
LCLICDLNRLNLHLMHLIKYIKSISQQRQISFSQVFLMGVVTCELILLSKHHLTADDKM